MTCEGVRELEVEYLKGRCSAAEAAGLEAHTASCAGCRGSLDDARSALALMRDALPDLSPSPDAWTRLEARLPKPTPARAFSIWIRIAAAASVVVAVLSFVALALPRGGVRPVVVETGQSVETGRPFAADRFSTLLLPDVGTLRLDAGSRLRFDGPRAVTLEAGSLFADILPSGRGFEVRAAGAVARVHGTRFGVTAPGTVYVVEGAVEVVADGRRIALGARQASVGARLVALDDHLLWLAEHERPAVRLRLDPRDRTTVTPGAPFKWHLILESDALAPLRLGRPRDLSQFLSLDIDGTLVPLDPNAAVLADSAVGPRGHVRLDLAHPCVLEVSVDPALFREKGPARVRAVYMSGAHAPEGVWVGTVRSEPVIVEVR